MKKKNSTIIATVLLAVLLLGTAVGSTTIFSSKTNVAKETESEVVTEPEEPYYIEELVNSLDDKEVPVQMYSENIAAKEFISDDTYVLAYRPIAGVKDFPSEVNPLKIEVDKYGTFILTYSDKDSYDKDYTWLENQGSTAFVNEMRTDDIIIKDETISVDGGVSTDGMSYVSTLMNSEEFSKKVENSDRNISIVVMDTGLYSANSAISKYVNTKDSYDFVNNDNGIYDGKDSHATYVTSTIVDVTGEKVASKLNIINAKVLENGAGSTYNAYLAILHYADMGVNIINCSFGARINCPMLKYASDYAEARGVILICSSGNESSYVGYPAANDTTIAVGAIDSNKEIASFSNVGNEVTFVAPGVSLLENGPEYKMAYVSGTSFSAPSLTGFSVLCMLENSGIHNKSDLTQYLLRYCEDLGSNGKDDYYGHGLPIYKKIEEPKEPETVKQPETTKEPETTKQPETSKQPETTKEPETSKQPESTKEPQTTKKPTNNTYTIRFDANGGSSSKNSKTVTNGATYGELPSANRDYYTFDGWYTSKEGGSKITSSSKVNLSSNQILYAHWTSKAESGWVDADKVPSGAKVTATKYQYTLTSYTTSDKSTLSGWTLYDTKSSWSNYGGWSDWSTNQVSGSDSRKVETKTEAYTYETGRKLWNYSHYRYWNSKYNAWYYTYSYEAAAANGYNIEYHELGWSLTEQYLYTKFGNSNQSWGTYINGECCGYAPYFNEQTKPETATGYRTLYRYADRNKIYTYYFKKSEQKESSSNPSGGSGVSNVKKLVKYIAK